MPSNCTVNCTLELAEKRSVEGKNGKKWGKKGPWENPMYKLIKYWFFGNLGAIEEYGPYFVAFEDLLKDSW
jgi:hypothetical protein